jgi:hypothetical protein
MSEWGSTGGKDKQHQRHGRPLHCITSFFLVGFRTHPEFHTQNISTHPVHHQGKTSADPA